MLIAVLALLQGVQAPAPPRREIPDPGTIATTQRVSPAGVQSVFTDRVFGVRFGAKPGEIWVTVHGSAYRLAWRDNAVRASARFDGRSGVQGIAIDPVTGRALFSVVGRLPEALALSRIPGSDEMSNTKSVTQLLAYDGEAPDDHLVVRWNSSARGDDIAGAPAVARRANATGHRVAVLPLPANDALAVFDADSGGLIKTIPLGVLPVAAVISDDGSVAYVSVFGGRKPRPRERAAPQCCDPFAELVRVDARGIAEPGNVTRVDLVAGTVRTVIPVRRHPTGLAWDESGGRLYVANGNSDVVSII